MTVSENIRSYLEEKGIKFSTVADKTGMRRDSFTGCMSGKRKITVDEYVRICAVLDVPLDQFVKNSATS